MLYLQILFILSFFICCILAFHMWRLNSGRGIPGVSWLILGCLAMGMTTLFTAISVQVGEWARTYVSHLFMIGGFVCFWLGVRRFVGHQVERYHYVVFALLMAVLAVAFFWFWHVNPNPQLRLTINSVILLYLSMRIAQSLFLARVGQKVVTVVGLLYLAFAFVNGFRCITIILSPALGSAFMSSSTSKVLTFLMVPILLGVLVAHVLMIRNEIDLSSVNGE